jgi:hypothetical protein
MNTQTEQRNVLTCTTHYRTLYEVNRTAREMDATAKKLVEKMAELQREIAQLQRQSNSISTALEAIGMRVEDDDPFSQPSDAAYAESRPFTHTSLVVACKTILRDHKNKSLTKTQVEYLAAIGGYPFATDDAKNSVDVTLRRLAEQGLCEVDRTRGPAGNQYRWKEDE